MATGTAHVPSTSVRIGRQQLEGMLAVPEGARGLVIFAHGSGSSRLSPRNAYVAHALNRRRLGTLLFDLLTDHEARDRGNVFDIPLLGQRLLEAVDAARHQDAAATLPLGLFGASTGAAAALTAAAERPDEIAAVVSRGGRPDLAAEALDRVRAPTLLIVGGDDHDVLRLNDSALRALTCDKELHIVSGATHLFEEEGALDEVVEAAGDWFESRLAGASS